MKIHSKEEEYVHFADSINNLNNAWRILQDIRQCKGSLLKASAFRFALIEYSKPYKKSNGKTAAHRLNDNLVPVEHRELHTRILAARDKIHAHSDLTVKEAKVYVANIASVKHAVIIEDIIHGTEEISNIDSIIELIEQTLDNMYIEVKQLEAALPINS